MFAKLYETEAFGQILIKIDQGDEEHEFAPVVKVYYEPKGFGVSSCDIYFEDSDQGWDKAEEFFDDSDEESVTTIIRKFEQALFNEEVH